jgi:hypothetical protein
MKNKLTQVFKFIYEQRTWNWTATVMFLIFLGGLTYYGLNFFDSKRPHVSISQKELKKGVINEDLTETDQNETGVSFEEYNKKYKAFQRKIPKAEWVKTQRELTDAEYEAALANWTSSRMAQISSNNLLMSFGIEPSNYEIPYPSRVETYTYSMKRLFDDVIAGYDTDSADFESKINIIEKMEHFLSLSDKKGCDTLLVNKFKDVLVKSKDLSLDEMKAIEKLHLSVTKTPLIFSNTKENKVFERQSELFNFYSIAANSDISAERFEQLEKLAKHLKVKTKVKDTVAVLSVLADAMKLDFSSYKEKDELGSELEMQCVDDFFYNNKIAYKAEDVKDQFSKFKDLFGKKLEAANLEKKARDILRAENRITAKDWMYFGFFFLCLGVMIVILVKLNNSIKSLNKES